MWNSEYWPNYSVIICLCFSEQQLLVFAWYTEAVKPLVVKRQYLLSKICQQQINFFHFKLWITGQS